MLAPVLRRLALVLPVLFLLPSPAEAQSLDIERFRPAPSRDGFLAIPGTRTPGPWRWNVSLWAGYSLEPLILRRVADDARIPIVQHRVSADLMAELGITDRIAVVVGAPFVLFQDVHADPLGSAQLATIAPRDGYVAARVRVLGDGARGEHEVKEGAGLALQVATTIPYGLEHTFAGEGNPQLEGAVLADFHFLGFGVGAIVGYRHRFAEPALLGVRFANELFFGAAVESPLLFVENTSAIFETRVETALDDEFFLGASTAVETDLGVRWADGDFAMTWLIGAGVSSGVGAPAFRGMFGFEWAPRVHDADGDGIPDSEEHPDCVYLAEDFDGFQDDDGCPDLDNDGDLVPDIDDRCPNEAAEFGRDADDDGCADPPIDTDGDGIEDEVDACPDEPGTADGDGCPDDESGVPDDDERCSAPPGDDGCSEVDEPPSVEADDVTLDPSPGGSSVDARTPSETRPETPIERSPDP